MKFPFKLPVRLVDGIFLVAGDSELICRLESATLDESAAIASAINEHDDMQARIKELEGLYFGLVEALAERFPALDGDRANDPILKRVDRWVRPEPEVARLAGLLADDEMESCLDGGEIETALKGYRQHCFDAFCRKHSEGELRDMAIERGLIEEE